MNLYTVKVRVSLAKILISLKPFKSKIGHLSSVEEDRFWSVASLLHWDKVNFISSNIDFLV